MTHQIGHHHMPDFDRIEALYIIWAESPEGVRRSLAAGVFEAIRPAWDALQTEYPREEMRLQRGARVLFRRNRLLP